MRDIFIVLFFLVTVYYCFKKPYIGVAAWIWIAFMIPTSWAFGFSQHLRLNLSIVLLLVVSYVLYRDKPKYNFTNIHFWVFLFCFWMLISTIFNLRLDSDYAWFKYREFVKVILLFVFITLTVHNKKSIDTIVWAIVLSVSAYAAMEATKFLLSFGGHEIVGRPGILEDRNDIAVAINMCLPLVLYLWSESQHKMVKLGLLILAALNVVAIVGTYSRGGFIGLVVLLFAIWLKSNRKFLYVILTIISLPLLYSAAPASWKERQSSVETASTQDGSFIGRLWAWKIATLIAIENPITGGGFKATTDILLWNTYANETPSFGPINTPPIPQGQSPKAAHNIYFQVLGSAGFVGLFIFLMMLLKGYLTCRTCAKHVNKDAEWHNNLAKAISLSLIAYGITGLNVSLAYFELVYALIALIAVLNTINMKNKKSLTQNLLQK